MERTTLKSVSVASDRATRAAKAATKATRNVSKTGVEAATVYYQRLANLHKKAASAHSVAAESAKRAEKAFADAGKTEKSLDYRDNAWEHQSAVDHHSFYAENL